MRINNKARAIIIETREHSIRSGIESADKLISYYTPHGISIYNHGVDLHLPKYETSRGIKYFEHETYGLIFNINSR